MRFFIIAIFTFFACGLQQKQSQSCNFSSQTKFEHSHIEFQLDFDDLIEYVLTGQLEHSHSHHDDDDTESHEHPHHHTSLSSIALADFMSEEFYFNYSLLKFNWPKRLQLNLFKSFQSEILRPPITA